MSKRTGSIYGRKRPSTVDSERFSRLAVREREGKPLLDFGEKLVADMVLNSNEDTTFLTSIGLKEHRDTCVHKKLCEVEETDKDLVRVKQDYAVRIRALKAKESEFLEAQKRTLESIDKFKAYIYDSDRKRRLSERRLAEKQKMGDEKDVEIQQLKERLKNTLILDRRLEISTRNIKNYSNYLEKLIDGESLHSADELIARYKLLQDMKAMTMKRVHDTEARVTALGREYQSFEKDKGSDILAKKTRVDKLREQVEENAGLTSNRSTESEERDEHRKKVRRMVTAIRNAVYNIYVSSQNSYPRYQGVQPFDPKMPEKIQNRTQRGRTDYYFEHVRKQLDKIELRLKELREIVPKHMMDREDSIFLYKNKKSGVGAKNSKTRTSNNRRRHGKSRRSSRHTTGAGNDGIGSDASMLISRSNSSFILGRC